MRPKLLTLTFVIVALLACSVAVGIAQPSSGNEMTSSLTTLTNEVRLLRAALEKSVQTQSQTQALSVYLSALQNRLNHSVERMDRLRIELANTDTLIEWARQEFEINERLLSSGHHALRTTEQRAPTVEKQTELKETLNRGMKEQADLRAQLSDVDNATREDIARWTEMVSRLDQLTRR